MTTDDQGPVVTAELADGPMAGRTTVVETVEGRPPKTIDVDAPGGARIRYCLDEWEQAGSSAKYSYLYEV